MTGPDQATLAKLICFFSVPTPGLKHKYCSPRELVPFWVWITEAERDEYRLFIMMHDFGD